MRWMLALLLVGACAHPKPPQMAPEAARFGCDPEDYVSEASASRGMPISVGMPLCSALARVGGRFAVISEADLGEFRTVYLDLGGGRRIQAFFFRDTPKTRLLHETPNVWIVKTTVQ